MHSICFRVTSRATKLKNDTTDDYGMVYKAGAVGIQGHFLDYVKEIKRGSIYKENSKLAMIYKDTVVFV